jgi:hypothetical protein
VATPPLKKEGKLLTYNNLHFSSFEKEEYPEGGRWFLKYQVRI